MVDNPLNTAQSYPSLTSSVAGTSNNLTSTPTMATVTSLLSQALTHSLPSTSSDGDEYGETGRRQLVELEDELEGEMLDAEEEDEEIVDENEDDDGFKNFTVSELSEKCMCCFEVHT